MNENNNSPTFYDALKIFAIFLLISFVLMSLGDILGSPKPKTPSDLLYAVFFTHIIGILVPVLIYIRVKKYNLKESLNLRPVPILTLLTISFISISFFILLSWLQGLLNPLFRPYEKDIIEYEKFFATIASASRSKTDIIMFIIGISAIPAITEEILFRGIILTGLKNSSTAAKAIILSGLLFGIIHLFPPQVVTVSILGIFFGILVIKSRSILTAIWCHFLNNLIIILSIFIV